MQGVEGSFGYAPEFRNEDDKKKELSPVPPAALVEKAPEQDVPVDLSPPPLPSSAGMSQFLNAASVAQSAVQQFPLQEIKQALAPVAALATAIPNDSELKLVTTGVDGIIFGVGYFSVLKQIEEKEALYEKASPEQKELLRGEIEALRARKEALRTDGALNGTRLGCTAIQQGSAVAQPLLASAPLALARVAGIVGPAAGSAASVLAVAGLSRQLDINRRLAEKIPFERNEAISKRDAAPNESLKQKILGFRVRNLDKQEEENNVSIFKNVIALFGSIFGTISGVQGLLVALGVGVGLGIGSALVGLGIAAGVLGGIALAIGIGYLIYKNRHAIQHAYRILSKAVPEVFKVVKIKIGSATLKSEFDEIKYATRKLETERYIVREKKIDGKIAEKTKEKLRYEEMNKTAGFFGHIGNYLHIFALKFELHALEHEKAKVHKKTTGRYRWEMHNIQKLSQRALDSTAKKLDALWSEKMALQKAREKLQEVYKVHQHLTKFGEGSKIDIQELQELHDEVVQKTDADFKDMQLAIKVASGATKDQLWDAVMEFATHPVEIT